VGGWLIGGWSRFGIAWVGGCIVSGYSALASYRIQEIFWHKLDKGIDSIARTQDISTGQIET
jgi:hypothetical protein